MEEKDYNECKLKDISGKLSKIAEVTKIVYIMYTVIQLFLFGFIILNLDKNYKKEYADDLYYMEYPQEISGDYINQIFENVNCPKFIADYIYEKFAGYESMSQIFMYMTSLITSALFIIIILHLAEDVFGRIYYYLRPFDEANINCMINIAKAMVLYSFVPSIVGSIFAVISASYYGEDIQILFNLELSVVFVAIIIYGFAEAFKYGSRLQRESDETI